MEFLLILFTTIITISLSMALIQLFIWVRQKQEIYRILFFLAALSASAIAIIEYNTFKTTEISVFESLVRYLHIPVFTLLISIIWFIQLYFKTGSKLLLYSISGIWIVCLLINFLSSSSSSLTYSAILEITTGELFNGEKFSIANGELNPWRLLADLDSLLILIYILHASIQLFRSGKQHRAIIVGGSLIFFMLVAGVGAPLLDKGIIKLPSMISLPFLAAIISMSFELIRDVVKVNSLSEELSNERKQWKNIIQEINLPVVMVDRNGFVEYANPFLLKLTGYSKEEIICKNWIETFIPAQEKSTLEDDFPIPLKKGFPVHYQNGILTKNGDTKTLMWSNVGIYDEKSELVGITAFGTDISRREQAFREIKNLKEQLEMENQILKDSLSDSPQTPQIICESNTTSYAFDKARQVAEVDSTVLLEGETGVGKGVFAKYIHENSSRKNKALVTVNCAAIPETLLESELFGYEKGAFTGATKLKKGRFELAHEGTIFLDEIGEIPAEIQGKLLRVIHDGHIERLGGEKTIKVDVRIIAATNKILSEEVRKGNFRSDLFYRLNVFPITVPPLRKRREDIPKLIEYFANHYKSKYEKVFSRISKQTYTSFIQYSWPGNVRELQNVIERAVISVKGDVLKTNGLLPVSVENPVPDNSLKRLEDVEREHILKVLNQCSWQIHGKNGAAESLGINPSTLRSRIKKLGIEKGELV